MPSTARRHPSSPLKLISTIVKGTAPQTIFGPRRLPPKCR
uniref:Uncharacterized protein n=1 Tax=Cucumis melo TaxID=3656 RepID=A0A9I9EH29_CUCME